MNAVGIVILNIACFVGLAVGAHFYGLQTGFALLFGWLGGAVLTLGIVATMTILSPGAAQSDPVQLDGDQTLAGASPETLRKWDMDLEAEQDRRWSDAAARGMGDPAGESQGINAQADDGGAEAARSVPNRRSKRDAA
ncbi:MAG: hypothetical protein AAGF79_11340 [Pseudomonadota bacterium]